MSLIYLTRDGLATKPYLVPSTKVYRDNVERKTIRQLHAFASREEAMREGFIRLIKQAHDIDTFVERDDYFYLCLKPKSRQITERYLRNLKLFLYSFVPTDEKGSWARNVKNIYYNSDRKHYQDCIQVTLANLLGRKPLVVNNHGGRGYELVF